MKSRGLCIDIIWDPVCPWCVLGYISLSQALAQLPGHPVVELRWHAFELNPGLPTGGQELRRFPQRRLGSSHPDNRQTLQAMGRKLGFQFDFVPAMRIYNTRKAHQLMQLAAEQNFQTELATGLFDTYFRQHLPLDDNSVLVNLAESVGLQRDAALASLQDNRIAATVERSQLHWQSEGVNSVPSFVIADRYVVSGTQSVERWRRALSRLVGLQDQRRLPLRQSSEC